MSPRPFVSVDELSHQVSKKGAEAEELINSLIRAIGRSVGINAGSIHWDNRTNIGDGGRDLVVEAEHNTLSEIFLPKKKSYWSIKSGSNGLDKSTFREEIRSHRLVQEWLQDGNTYVWCSLIPSRKIDREAVEEDVDFIVDEFSNTFSKDQFEFRWIDQVTDAVNLHPAVVLQHIPVALNRRSYLRTLSEWKSLDEERTNWVDFDERAKVVDHLIKHLLSNESPNIIHIAGMSGIGKSRLVREACSRLQADHGIGSLYCESYDQIRSDLPNLMRLFGTDRHAILIIDEVPFNHELDIIESHFGNSAEKLRIVTICPAIRQITRIQGNRILLGEPSGKEAILSVINQTKGVLSDERLQMIAAKSAQDLRFALRWVKEINRDPEGANTLTGGPMPLLDHILRRSGLNRMEQDQLRILYDAASCFIDIGVGGVDEKEIDSLKDIFSLSDTWLNNAILNARNHGLSAKGRNYLEATPRGLAEMVFAQRGWATVSRNLNRFFDALPSRLQRKFIERCQDSPLEIREEVLSQLGNYFRGILSGRGLEVLYAGKAAKIFSAWASFNPASGLDWLARTVESASDEDLLEFKGDAVQGDYAGRRHIVFLCDSLSRFPEYFKFCERILFRLAITENEPSIGNNATGIWKSLFWPTLSQSALPFDERSQVLLGRLRRATGEKGILCIDAAFDVLQSRSTGFPVPPRVVGGILAPAPWRVTSTDQLKELRQGFAEMFLKACTSLDEKELKHFQTTLPKNLIPFVFLDLTDALRSVYGAPLNVSIAVAMTESIRRVIQIVEQERYKHQGVPWTKSLREWEADLKPRQLKDRLAFLLQQSPWELEDSTDGNDPYKAMAEELSVDTSSLGELCTVLSNDENRGAFNLGNACGRRENHLSFDSQVKTWLRDGMCESYVTGYIFARLASSDIAIKEWQDELDQIVQTQPLYCATITTNIDLSERGFKRLMSLVDIGAVSDVQVYSRLGVGGWLNVLSDNMQTDVCNRLAKVDESARGLGASIAVDLIFMWTHLNNEQVPSHLKEFCLLFMQLAVTSTAFKENYKWSELARKLVDEYPVQIAKLILDMNHPSTVAIRFDMESLDPILVKAATLKPKELMDLLGDVLLNEETRMIFEIVRHEGVFEKIGQQVIEDWIAENGSDYMGNIASHLASPFVDQHGQVVVPTVLDWLFSIYEDDDEMFEGFLSGRHRLNVRVGNVEIAEVEHAMKPFMEHPSRRVRDWALWEIQQAKRESEWFEDYEEKRKRR